MTPAPHRSKEGAAQDDERSRATEARRPLERDSSEGRIKPHVGAYREHTRTLNDAPTRAPTPPKDAPRLRIASPLSDLSGFFDSGEEKLIAKPHAAAPATRPAKPSEVRARAASSATKGGTASTPAAKPPTPAPAAAPIITTRQTPAKIPAQRPTTPPRVRETKPTDYDLTTFSTDAYNNLLGRVDADGAKPWQEQSLVEFELAPGPRPKAPDHVVPGFGKAPPATLAPTPVPETPEWEVTCPTGALLLGNISAKGGVMIGASALMNGSIRAGGSVAIGDHAEITGTIEAKGPVTIGFGADLGPVRIQRGLSAAPSEGVHLKPAMHRHATPLGPQTAIAARYVATPPPAPAEPAEPFGGMS